MDIDVIIPTFNRAHTLLRAIDSVLNQTFQNFNLYVIDDASTDSTLELITKYSSIQKFHFHQLEINRGVSNARNTGAKLGHAPLLAFLDSDDEWLPTKLERQINFLKDNPAIDFIHSEEIWIRNGVRVNPKIKHSKASHELFKRSLEHCLISPSTVLMKRELYFQFGGFNPEMIVCEDYDLWLKILLSNEVGFIETPLIKKYGGHDDQLSTKFKAMDYWRIKSLIHLLSMPNVNLDQKNIILETIEKKSKLLLSNLKKHNHHTMAQEIIDLLACIDLKLT